MPSLFIFGLGYTGSRLAYHAAYVFGWKVYGTVRSETSAKHLTDSPHFEKVYSWDSEKSNEENDMNIAEMVKQCDFVVSTVAPPRSQGGKDPILSLPVFLDALTSKNESNVKWIGYLSTTGVYGDHDGKVVTEISDLHPTSGRTQRRTQAENLWKSEIDPNMLRVFRLPGIYGPGRGALVKARSGKFQRILIDLLFSRIHVDDIVLVLMKSMMLSNEELNRTGPFIYNVVDDKPSKQAEVYKFICDLIDIPCPEAVSFEIAQQSMSEMAKSFYQGGRKVVSNELVKKELNIKDWKFPTYVEGLTGQINQEIFESWWCAKSEELENSQLLDTPFLDSFSGTPLTFDANVDGKQEISVCLLVDNGSLKEGSVLSLRFLADALQSKLRAKEQIKNEELEDKKSGEGERKRSAVPFIHVVPCSARFSNRIAKEKLGGISGLLIEDILSKLVYNTKCVIKKITVVPLFFGPSKTATEFIPGKVFSCKGNSNIDFLSSSYVLDDDKHVTKIAQILLDNAIACYDSNVNQGTTKGPDSLKTKVIVLEHGSPDLAVHEVRDKVVTRMQEIQTQKEAQNLSGFEIIGACMERRDGPEYDFNDPLLEKVLAEPYSGMQIVCPMFFSPGRHAGENGDIAEIIKESKCSDVFTAQLVGQHPAFPNVLEELYHSARQLF